MRSSRRESFAANGNREDPTGILRLTVAWKPTLTLIALILGVSFITVATLGFLMPSWPLRTFLITGSAVLLVPTGRALWLVHHTKLKRTLNLLVFILLATSSGTVLLSSLHGPADITIAAAASFMLPLVLAGLAPGRRTLALATLVTILAMLVITLLPLLPGTAGVKSEQQLALALITVLLTILAMVMDRITLTVREVAGVLAGYERIRASLNRRIADKTRDRENAEAATVQALEKERAARTRLEQINQQLIFLTDLGLLLTSDLDRGDWLARLPSLLVPRLAAWSALDLVDEEGRLYRVAVATQDEKGATVLDFGSNEGHDRLLSPAVREALEGQTSVIIRALRSRSSATTEPAGNRLKPARGSEVLIPLRTHGKVLGILTLASHSEPEAIDHDEQRFLIDVGRQAALAIDNTRLYHRAVELAEELERRVVERTEQLETVNSELEAFTYSVSHDLRGPLRGIDGFSQALAEDYGDRLDETALGYLGRIRRGASRMGELIDDLLSLSRLSQSPLRPGPVNLGKLARKLFAELQETAPGRAARLVLQGNLDTVADRRLLTIALENLLANSWKFSANGAETVITVGARQQDGETVFFVQDNGVGFDMEYAAKLFMPFQRLHSHHEFEGSGIGLATVHRIISRHGGHIWAEGTVDKGASIFFTLPGAGSRH
jgi:signal transduction histidine kinase